MALAVGFAGTAGASTPGRQGEVVDPEVIAAAREAGGEPVRVLVVLDEEGTAARAGSREQTLGALQLEARAGASAIEPSLARLEGAGEIARVRAHWLVPAISMEAKASAISRLASEPGVSAILLDRRQHLVDGPADLAASRSTGAATNTVIPWGIAGIRAPDVWNQLGHTGRGVIVAHLDTGVDYTHPDLAAHIWRNTREIPGNGIDDDGNGYVDDVRGWDFSLDRADPMDDWGHGTHTAGTIVGDGTLGVATGVAPGATLMPLKVLSNGYGYESDAWTAIEYAVANGADVITMSLGWISCYHHPSRALWRALAANVEAAGVFMVSAAGNEGDAQGMPWYCAPPGNIRTPADIPNVLAVGAVSSSATVPSFSSVGPTSWSSVPEYADYPYPPGLRKPDVAAPGVGIISTLPGGRYSPATWDGTSMACPHVAGAAALMLSANHSLTPAQIRAELEQSAVDVLPTGPDNYSGSGRIDAYAAVRLAMATTGTDIPGQSPGPVPANLPTRLDPVAPNPVQDHAELHFSLAADGPVSLEIYGVTGRRVARLVEGRLGAGEHAASWTPRDANGEPLGSGVYWARLNAGGHSEIQKLVLAR